MKSVKDNSLISLTIPIFLELLLIIIVSNIDTIMLGSYSDKAVGAVGGMSQILNIQNSIFGFINLATTILCSQFLGARSRKKVQEIITVSLIVNLIIGIIMGFFYFMFWEFILKTIKLPSDLINIGKFYFQLVGGFCVFQGLTLTCGAILKSYGNPKLMLYINIGVNILNILGNSLFLFGWFGMPILGATGVGISTVISRAIGCIIAFIVMSRYCKFRFRRKIFFSFPLKEVKRIISIGIPAAGVNLSWNIAQVIIMTMVNSMGMIVITSRTYLMLISNFVMTFSIALGQATSIQIGHLIGAKEIEKAYYKCFKSLKISLILAFVVSSLVVVFKTQIIELFTTNKFIIETSLKVFPYMVLLEVGRVTNIVVLNSLQATGDIKYPMTVGIVFIFIVAVPFAYLFGIGLKWGLVGIWIANACDEWIRAIFLLFRWKSKKWQTKSFV